MDEKFLTWTDRHAVIPLILLIDYEIKFSQQPVTERGSIHLKQFLIMAPYPRV